MKKIILFLSFLLLVIPIFVGAQEKKQEKIGQEEKTGIIVSPRIIDEKAKAGDLLKYNIKVKNNTERKVNIYATLNDLSSTEGEIKFIDPAELDKTTSLVRWIKFKRGVIELMPGEETEVPLKINISTTAVPGKRFARIAFPNGSNRHQAEGRANGESQLLINVEIVENVIEKAQIKEFLTINNVFLSSPVSFILKLNNSGNQNIVPEGKIYIYNRRGEEVTELDVNSDKETVMTGDLWGETIDWKDAKGFGKFKAKIELEYGKKDKRDLQDTVFFWIFPWKFLVIFFGITFVFFVLMVTLIFKKTYIHHHVQEHNQKTIRKKTGGKIINLKK